MPHMTLPNVLAICMRYSNISTREDYPSNTPLSMENRLSARLYGRGGLRSSHSVAWSMSNVKG